MKIELKSIKTFRGMEGEGFNAVLRLDDYDVRFIIDEGGGGEIYIQPIKLADKKADELFRVFEQVVKQSEHYKENVKDWEGNEEGLLRFSVDLYLARMVDQWQIAKILKRHFTKAIVWGVPNGDTINKETFRYPLEYIKEKHPEHFRAKIKEIQAEIEKRGKGEKILNTNLEGWL